MNKIVLITILLLSSLTIWSQEAIIEDESYDRVYMADIGIGIFDPQGALSVNIPKTHFNIDGAILAQIAKGKPFFGGIYIHGSAFSSFSSEVNRQTDFGFERWDATTKSNLIGIGALTRVFMPFQPLGIQPYFDFNFGTNVFYTYTNFTFPDSDETSTTYDETDGIWSYGLGFGLNYPINGYIYLKSKISYAAGLSGRYYVEEHSSIDEYSESTLDAFELKQTATDAVKWDIGVTFAF